MFEPQNRWEAPLEGAPDPRIMEEADLAHEAVGRAELALLRAVAKLDRGTTDWESQGAADTEHFLGIRYGISRWKAERWVEAARALEELPRIARALEQGELGIDKVVELTRFVTAQTEEELIRWAKGVSCGAVRHRGDLSRRASIQQEARLALRDRFLAWSFMDEGRRFELRAELPAAEGAALAQALERAAEQVPAMPDEQGPLYASARRADALVVLCAAGVAPDADAERAMVVIHAQAQGLMEGTWGAELEGGPVIHPETARRLACSGRLQLVLEDASGEVLAISAARRDPPAWMLRQLRYRDRECRFPGCGARRFTQAHHISWWSRGGRTELANLVLTCYFHHRLVHEAGWSLSRAPDGEVRWFRPDGTPYRAGPSPGEGNTEIGPPAVLSAAG